MPKTGAGLGRAISQLSKAVAADKGDLIDFSSGDLEPVAHEVKQAAGSLVAKAQKAVDKKKLEPVVAAPTAGAESELPSDSLEPSEQPTTIADGAELGAGAVSIQPLGMSCFERLVLSTIIASESHFAEIAAKLDEGEAQTKQVSTQAAAGEVGETAPPVQIETPDVVEHVSNGAPTSDVSPGLDEMVISSTNQTDFDLNDSEMVFSGNVQVKSPRFNLRADKFIVHLKTDRSGMSFGEAIGDVVIDLREGGQATGYTGQADSAIYDPGEGKITLTGWPKIRQQFKEHVAITRDTTMILYTDGRVKTLGRNRTLIRR